MYVTVPESLGTSRPATPVQGSHLTYSPYIYIFPYRRIVIIIIHYLYIKTISIHHSFIVTIGSNALKHLSAPPSPSLSNFESTSQSLSSFESTSSSLSSFESTRSLSSFESTRSLSSFESTSPVCLCLQTLLRSLLASFRVTSKRGCLSHKVTVVQVFKHLLS